MCIADVIGCRIKKFYPDVLAHPSRRLGARSEIARIDPTHAALRHAIARRYLRLSFPAALERLGERSTSRSCWAIFNGHIYMHILTLIYAYISLDEGARKEARRQIRRLYASGFRALD